jgi:hypothetical protein
MNHSAPDACYDVLKICFSKGCCENAALPRCFPPPWTEGDGWHDWTEDEIATYDEEVFVLHVVSSW